MLPVHVRMMSGTPEISWSWDLQEASKETKRAIAAALVLKGWARKRRLLLRGMGRSVAAHTDKTAKLVTLFASVFTDESSQPTVCREGVQEKNSQQ